MQRDGLVCIATKSVKPDVCHIWPFAANDTYQRRDKLRNALIDNMLTLSPDMRKKLAVLVAPLSGELGGSDKAWNMLSLNTQLHRYWGKAYFGLRWVGVEDYPLEPVPGTREVPRGEAVEEGERYATFRVEWHWLPDGILDALRSYSYLPKGEKCNARRLLDLDSSEAIESIVHSLRGPISRPNLISTKGATARDENGHLLESGRVLSLKVDSKDIDKMKVIIEAQWLAVQIAALSGAGEVADELDKDPPPPALVKDVMLPRLFGPGGGAEGEDGETTKPSAAEDCQG